MCLRSHAAGTHFAFTFGAFYGGFVALLAALVMDFFSGRNIGAIIAVLYSSAAFGTLMAQSVARFAFDLQHSYLLPILASTATRLIAAIVILCLKGERSPEPA